MIVHFIGSRSKVIEEIDYYREIIGHIKAGGHTLASEWVEDTYSLLKQGQLKKENETWDDIDGANATAISKADVIVVESTKKSFFAGYRVAQAAIQKKPLLILTRDKSPVAVSGLRTPTGFVKSVRYDSTTLPVVVNDFLKENTIRANDLRFNFVLDRQTYNYLRWTSSETGKTKAQIIRALLQREMKKDAEEL